MSSTSNVTGNTLSTLATQLFNSVDGNKDGKLSQGEFRSFLEGLLSKLGEGNESETTTPSVASPKLEETRSVVYQPMLGFDYTKLNTPSHTTPKYVFARATQDLSFAWDRPSRSAGLERIAEYARANGYPNTTVIGDDKLNFGDGHGEIDVLTGDGQWWWGPLGTGA